MTIPLTTRNGTSSELSRSNRVVWYRWSRNSPNNVTSRLFYSFNIDGGNTWSPNVAVSNPFNPFIGYPNQSKIGDYITVVSDDDSANVAYSAIFNGEEDISYVRISSSLPPTDFNRDARPDLLLFHATMRQTAVWYINNNVRIGNAFGPTLPVGWTVAALGDFNTDGYPDYLLFNANTGGTIVWYMRNNVRIGSATNPTLPAENARLIWFQFKSCQSCQSVQKSMAHHQEQTGLEVRAESFSPGNFLLFSRHALRGHPGKTGRGKITWNSKIVFRF